MVSPMALAKSGEQRSLPAGTGCAYPREEEIGVVEECRRRIRVRQCPRRTIWKTQSALYIRSS